jgi:hypothetical protein
MLPVLDPLGRLVPNAAIIFYAFSLFPDDPVTAWAFIEALERAGDLKGFTETEPALFRWFEAARKKRNRSRVAALMYAGALCDMKADGRDTSHRRATHLLATMAGTHKGLKDKKYPSDERNVRDAFDKFKPGIHLILAQRTDEAAAVKMRHDEASLRKSLSLALLFQSFIEENRLIPDWNPWRIDQSLYIEGMAIKPGGLTDDALRVASEYTARPDRDRK